METQKFRTFKAKLYDMTPLGEVLVGTVRITIDFCGLNERSLSSKFVLKDIIEVDELPTFNIMDFPDDSDTPNIDIQAAPPSPCIPLASSDAFEPFDFPLFDFTQSIQTDDTAGLSDFQSGEVCDDFSLNQEQVEALYNEETVQWYPMNSPPGKLGIEVNEFGEVRSTNTEIHLMAGGDARMKVSKYNQNLGGQVYTVYLYRAGKQKLYDFHLATEVFKTFNPEYSAYQLELRYENRNTNDCALVNLSVQSFNLTSTAKGRSVTDDRVLLEEGQYWMSMI